MAGCGAAHANVHGGASAERAPVERDRKTGSRSCPMRLASIALIGLAMIVSAGAQAQAQAPQTRIRGTVERLDGQSLTVKTQEGTTTVALAPSYSVGAVVKA